MGLEVPAPQVPYSMTSGEQCASKPLGLYRSEIYASLKFFKMRLSHFWENVIFCVMHCQAVLEK